MSKFNFRNPNLYIILALLAGLGLGLTYAWLISPVKYVDASPAILRVNFKDQYREVIAASYAANTDLPRARARLALLGDSDPVAELSAQAQRMLAAGDSFDQVRPLAQLATDLQQGFASAPITSTPAYQIFNPATQEIPLTEITPTDTPFVESAFPTDTPEPEGLTSTPTPFIAETVLAPQPLYTPTPRPTFTPMPAPGAPFTLVGQDTVCDPTLKAGLLQFMLYDSSHRQVPGIEIIVNWDQGEDHFFTGLKPDMGNGYADFNMQPNTTYSVRVIAGGSFVPNITAPTCTATNGATYTGGLLLTFQQP